MRHHKMRCLIRVYTVCHSPSYFKTQHWVVNCTCSNFRLSTYVCKKMRCLNTKSKYSKVTDTEIKWLIISTSVMIIIFVEFINQLIDYPINCVSLSACTKKLTLKAPRKIWSRRHSIYFIYFFLFSEKTSLDFSCESSAQIKLLSAVVVIGA